MNPNTSGKSTTAGLQQSTIERFFNCVHSLDSILSSAEEKEKKITFLVPHGTAMLRNIQVPTCKNVHKTTKCTG